MLGFLLLKHPGPPQTHQILTTELRPGPGLSQQGPTAPVLGQQGQGIILIPPKTCPMITHLWSQTSAEAVGSPGYNQLGTSSLAGSKALLPAVLTFTFALPVITLLPFPAAHALLS